MNNLIFNGYLFREGSCNKCLKEKILRFYVVFNIFYLKLIIVIFYILYVIYILE